MRSKLFLVLATVVLSGAACGGGPGIDATGTAGAPGSGGAPSADGGSADGAAGQDGGPIGLDGQADDDRLFVPEGVTHVNQDGQDQGLVLVAFTLVPGASGPSFYAAVQNVFSTPLCEAGMMLNFFDHNDQLVGTAASVLQSGRLYQLSDGTVIPCVDPGQIAMTGATGLESSIVVDQIGTVQHLFPSFEVDVTPIGGLTVMGVETVASPAGTAYTGTVVNTLAVASSDPSVAIFPVNRVGRPLGMATASVTMDMPPGSSWTFQTSAVDDPGINDAAFATGSVP